MVIRTALPTEAQELALLGERLWRETYMGLIPQSNLELHLAETFGLVQQTAELADPDSEVQVKVGDTVKAVVVSTVGGLKLSHKLARGAATRINVVRRMGDVRRRNHQRLMVMRGSTDGIGSTSSTRMPRPTSDSPVKRSANGSVAMEMPRSGR